MKVWDSMGSGSRVLRVWVECGGTEMVWWSAESVVTVWRCGDECGDGVWRVWLQCGGVVMNVVMKCGEWLQCGGVVMECGECGYSVEVW